MLSKRVAIDRVHNIVGHCLLPVLFCVIMILCTACSSSTNTSSSINTKRTLSTSGGSTITYSTGSQDVLVRIFYGGGKLGTLEMSPEISIYGDGTYILGPGLQMRQGHLSTDALQHLLNSLVDIYGLLRFSRQQFYDIPDQNATMLFLMLDGKQYQFLYGPFGHLQENPRELDEYQRLGKALTSITEALTGPTHNYANTDMALLVHQTFSPDLNQNIPYWSFRDFTLFQLATFECGSTPPDETGPNADSGCLTYTVPHTVLLLNTQQLKEITMLLHGQQQGVFLEGGLYYDVVLRPLLPDEQAQKALAMLGSQELSYSGVSLVEGPVPIPTLTPTR